MIKPVFYNCYVKCILFKLTTHVYCTLVQVACKTAIPSNVPINRPIVFVSLEILYFILPTYVYPEGEKIPASTYFVPWPYYRNAFFSKKMHMMSVLLYKDILIDIYLLY